ncbi:DNA fragmentation factor subunit beta [Diorhabda carinulata]|uniref:DNA fragmentation factor subunit beta n=1 Tax=Diorhabda carinulata TaxID=1163345 RepID=UPI0025A04EB4|nr:DNA fragmentation factor subunit beta [Diorhabda carinulata]XP_057659926.1 DNA fragmentation factor subunit beta [Diorhabda carinulata]
MTTTKGFRVTDADRKIRVGIAVKNLVELKKKTIDKFKLKFSPGQIDFQTTDGTIIENEEYFQTLPAQTLLIWVKVGERAATDAEILYKTIREVNDEYLTAGEKVQEFFTEKMKNKVLKLAEVLKGLDADKGKFSTKADHPEWFEGLNTNAKTKEEYMFKRAQDRIRSYFYKTKDELRNRNDLPRNAVNDLFLELDAKLKLNKYHGCYFDRASSRNDDDMKSICNSEGTFRCQGRWDREQCLYAPRHSINPYNSRESRIVFQTWNLDHNKERSRSVIPAVCAALRASDPSDKNVEIRCDLIENETTTTPRDARLDVKAIYNDLFTLKNLKIVHIICHDKGVHRTAKAGPYLLY